MSGAFDRKNCGILDQKMFHTFFLRKHPDQNDNEAVTPFHYSIHHICTIGNYSVGG